MATQAEIVARLQRSVENQRIVQAALKATAPTEAGAEALADAEDVFTQG